jgi:dehydratase
MKFVLRRTGARIGIGAAIALIPMLALVSPASAAPTEVLMDCEANAPILGPQHSTMPITVDVQAPGTVAPGGALDVVVDPAPGEVPESANGIAVKEINTYSFEVLIPSNTTFVSADLTGGSNLGDTPPTLTVADGVATLSFPGPIAGGSTFEMPTITLHLTAGQSGIIESRLSGTSYGDPGLSMTAVATFLGADIEAPTACFPNPSPVFTTTTIQ